MTNFWYVANPHEILIDMDRPKSSLLHAEKRLAGAIVHNKLQVFSIELHESFSSDHVHARIVTPLYLSALERAVWAMALHSDIYRGLCTIMRIYNNIMSPDLLITPTPFVRPPDAWCECESKHNAETMNECPAAKQLRGEKRTVSFFGRLETLDFKLFRMNSIFYPNWDATQSEGDEQNGRAVKDS